MTSTATGEQLWSDSQTTVFNEKTHAISIKLNRATWEQLHNDESANGCVKGDDVKWWHARGFTVDGKEFPDAAIKVKGNTSRCVPRLQFSVRLDKTKGVFTKTGRGVEELQFDAPTKRLLEERTLAGMTSFSLRRSANDSSAKDDYQQGMLARESVATWAMAQTEDVRRTTKRGAPVYRTAYTTVEFRLCDGDRDSACAGAGNFTRAYLIAEDINPDFFKQRYDDSEPTAFSMSLGCALKLDGQGKHAWSAKCLEPEFVDGKKWKSDDAGAVQAAAAMFDGPNGLVTRLQAARSKEDVEQVVELDSILNYAAGATVTGHWDSAYGNFNNDVLYFNKSTKRWRIVTWDMDNTFDFDNAMGAPSRSYSYKDGEGHRALFDRIFAIPEVDGLLKQRIRDYLARLHINRDSGPLHARLATTVATVKSLNDKLHPAETQNLALSREMGDYARVRFDELTRQVR
ncbi:MAG: CotH kinase family protein [Myxococcales bacterium]|nr:CotH kinase family protein [Myxococcales bacterium]